MATQMAIPTTTEAQYYGAQGRQDRGPPDRGPSDQYRQGFQDGYRSGYRAGNDSSKNRQRYDDTDYSYGYGYDNPRRGYFNGPSASAGYDDRGQQNRSCRCDDVGNADDSFLWHLTRALACHRKNRCSHQSKTERDRKCRPTFQVEMQ